MGKDSWGELRRALEEAGWQCRNRHAGHVVIYNSDGKRVWQMPATASDHRSYLNTLRDLKRAIGFTMPKKGRS